MFECLMFDLRKTYNWSELLGLTESRGDNNSGQLVVWDHYYHRPLNY